MQKLIVKGKKSLSGLVKISGSKNATLPILAASILNKEKIELSNWELVSVNPNSKNWNWTDIFCFWSVGTQSIISFALISSLYLLYDLNFYEVFFGTIIASLLICFLSLSGFRGRALGSVL